MQIHSPVIAESVKRSSDLVMNQCNYFPDNLHCEMFGVTISFLFCLYNNRYNDVFIYHWEFCVLSQQTDV